MQYETMTRVDLEKILRNFDPSSRGRNGLAQKGSKQDIIDRLRIIGITEEQAVAFIEAQKDTQETKQETQETKQETQEQEEQETQMEQQQQISFQPFAAMKQVVEQQENTMEPIEVTMQNNDAAGKLALLQQILGGKAELDESRVREIAKTEAQTEMDNARIQMVKDIAIAVTSKVKELVDEAKKQMCRQLEVKLETGEVKSLGTVHEKTEKIIRILQRKGRNLMLVGPAGSGKTTVCEKAAEALGLEFHALSIGPETFKSDLLGFVDAAGVYHETEVYKAFVNGGLLLLDEVDAGNAGSLTIINSLLENGYCAFPGIGMMQRHENFRCVCEANTFGRGANRQYVGRNKLDAAFLNRFVVEDFDYDEKLERVLAGNDEWVDRVQKYRKMAMELRMEVVISPRASIQGARLLEDGFTVDEVEDMVVWKGIPAEQVAKIKGIY